MDHVERGREGRYTHKQFLEVLEKEQVDVDVLEPYSGMWSPCSFRCRKCGHEWTTVPHALIYGRGCETCRQERMAAARDGSPEMTHDEFVARVFEANHDLIVIGKFKDMDAFVPCMCARCHRTWMGHPRRMLAGMGCRCSNFSHSGDGQRLEAVSGFPIEEFGVADGEWASEFYPMEGDYVTPDEMDGILAALLA